MYDISDPDLVLQPAPARGLISAPALDGLSIQQQCLVALAAVEAVQQQAMEVGVFAAVPELARAAVEDLHLHLARVRSRQGALAPGAVLALLPMLTTAQAQLNPAITAASDLYTTACLTAAWWLLRAWQDTAHAWLQWWNPPAAHGTAAECAAGAVHACVSAGEWLGTVRTWAEIVHLISYHTPIVPPSGGAGSHDA